MSPSPPGNSSSTTPPDVQVISTARVEGLKDLRWRTREVKLAMLLNAVEVSFGCVGNAMGRFRIGDHSYLYSRCEKITYCGRHETCLDTILARTIFPTAQQLHEASLHRRPKLQLLLLATVESEAIRIASTKRQIGRYLSLTISKGGSPLKSANTGETIGCIRPTCPQYVSITQCIPTISIAI